MVDEKRCWQLDKCLTCGIPCYLEEGELDPFENDEGEHECSMACYCGCTDCSKGCLGC